MDTHTYMHRHACAHTMDYYSARKRNKISPFAETWVELEAATQNEVSQRERHKYSVLRHTCADLKMVQIILFAKQKQTHR